MQNHSNSLITFDTQLNTALLKAMLSGLLRVNTIVAKIKKSREKTNQSESARNVASKHTRLQSFNMSSNISFWVQNMAVIG